MQDSLDDWSAEASKMGEVYRNGLCNLAASSAADGDGGMFFDRNPLLVQPIWLNIRLRDKDGMTTAHSYLLFDAALWIREVESAILNSRGWVIQERFLAPRVLHFTAGQLFWECRQRTACETYPDHISSDDLSRPYTELRDVLSKISTQTAQQSEDTGRLLKHAAYCWSRFIYSYSRCHLSNEEDVLVAISGVAKEVQRVTNDEYLAGIWKRTFIHDILWRRSSRLILDQNQNQLWTRPQPLLAPTWSWASLKGPIEPARDSRDPQGEVLIQLLETHIIGRGKDLTGQILFGSVRIRCRVFSASCNFKLHQAGHLFDKFDLTIAGQRIEQAWAAFDEPETADSLCRGDLFFMPVRYGARAFGAELEGLLLKHIGLGEIYERVGYFLVRPGGQDELQVLQQYFRSLDEIDITIT